jgi:hypothetical protein
LCGVIPRHDLTATLTERDGGATMEITLTYYPAVGEPEDIGYEPEYWGFTGDTFPQPGAPELSDDFIDTFCIEGSPALSIEYDGVSSDTTFVTLSPFHAVMDDAHENINTLSRYSSIVINDPEA